MKSQTQYYQLINERRTKTALNINNETSRMTEKIYRKTSIVINESAKNNSQGDQKKLYLSTRQIQSPPKHRHYKSEILQKSQTQKGSLKEIESNSVIREGELYNKISPKVVFQNNKVNVFFIKELNKYTQLTQPKSTNPFQEAINTVQEVKKQRVAIKGPLPSSPIKGHYISGAFAQGALSNHRELLSTVLRKTEREQPLNTSLKGSLNKLLKLYH